MESKNVWQQILGGKNLGSKFFWMKIRGAKWGTNFFERHFLGRKFWKACFGGADSFGEEFFASKKSFGGRKEYWEAKMFWRKDMGSKKI